MRDSHRIRRLLHLESLEDRLAPAISVTTFNDVLNSGDGVTSLREAIIQANSTAGDDVIQLQAGTYYLSLSGSNEDAAATGDLDILNNGSITIVGVGSGQTTIHAGGDGGSIPALGDRVIDVKPGAVLNLENLNITGGNTVHSGAGISIGSSATANVTNSTIYGNHSTNSSGGGFAVGDFAELVLQNSTVSGNIASAASAIQINVTATTTIRNSTITSNHSSSAVYGHNPAVRNLGELTLGNTIIAANTGVDSTGYDGYNDGTVNSLGYNIIGNNQGFSFTPATGDQIGTSVSLGWCLGDEKVE
jgi:fibronectin-binding autotransporter adhesin